jgi:DNA-binding transcriptional LysR family regulator
LDGRLVGNIGVLAAIIEGGSFARAADALGLSPSGISRAIARLEARIGVRLLDRTTRSVGLTDEGRRLYAEIGPLLTGIEDAVTVTAGAAAVVRGRLRVNVDAFFSRFMLAPHLGRFLERYPEISLDLIAREQLGDLVAEGFDVALRFGAASSSSSRASWETRTVTVAAPPISKARPAGGTCELTGHACIQVRNSQTGQPLEWEFRRGGKILPVKTSGGSWSRKPAACWGLPCRCRHRADQGDRRQALIDQGQLIELFRLGRVRPSLYALYPSRHLPAKVKAFIDFVAEVVAGSRNSGEGGARRLSPASITAMASRPNRHAG